MMNQKPVMKFFYSSYENIFIYSGKYWIDPNHGSTSDAIEVHCIIESGRKKTCIEPNENSNKQVRTTIFSMIRNFFLS